MTKDLNKTFSHKLDIKSLEEMNLFAKDFLGKILPEIVAEKTKNGAGQSAIVVCLSGDLGSGKTTFTQNIAKLSGVAEYVTSPTFILQKKYQVAGAFSHDLKDISQIIHMDMYRIEKLSELDSLGFYEALKDPKNLLILEWPEKVLEAIPANGVWLSFEFVDETTRRVQW